METWERFRICATRCEFAKETGEERSLSPQKRGGDMSEDIQVKREIVLEADAETLEKMRKEGHARGFTVYCDEGERSGGENTAPPPLAYFGLSLAF